MARALPALIRAATAAALAAFKLSPALPAAAAAMPPTAERVQPVLRRLHSTRPREQRSAIQALQSFADAPAGCRAVIAAGGVAALLDCASANEQLADEVLGVLCKLGVGGGPEIAVWKAGMQAAAAVPRLVGLLGSSRPLVQQRSAVLLQVLASEADAAVATAAAQHGAAAALVQLLHPSSPPGVREAAVGALCELACSKEAASALLRSEAAGAVAPMVLDGTLSEDAQESAATALGNLAHLSERRGMAVVRAGGTRVLVQAVQCGSPTTAAAAVYALGVAANWSPAVQAALTAEGAIPTLEAFQRTRPSAEAADHAERLLRMLRDAQQARQQALRADGVVDEAPTSDSSGGDSAAAAQAASQPGAARDGAQAAAHASSASAEPAAAGCARQRAPHVCGWCGIEAPGGVRFKKGAACQQVVLLLYC